MIFRCDDFINSIIQNRWKIISITHQRRKNFAFNELNDKN